MWVIFHRKVGTKVIKGGRSFLERCPECGREARFDEVEVTESYGVFFVLDIIDDQERKFRCSVCGELFDLRDEPERETPPARTARELAAERAAAEARRAAEAEQRRQRAEARANRIEDELAELKKRMGR